MLCIWGGCDSGVGAGDLLIARLMVQSLAVCPEFSCTVHSLAFKCVCECVPEWVNETCRVKHLECGCYVRISPLTIGRCSKVP